jgi:hypothetical protein
MGNGNAAKFKGFAEACMAEYDLNGWTVPDLINPGDHSLHGAAKVSTKRVKRPQAARPVADNASSKSAARKKAAKK